MDKEAQTRELLPEEHFTVDGKLPNAWTSMKSVQPKDGRGGPSKGFKNPDGDYHGEQRVLIENRNGPVVDIDLTQRRGGRSGRRRCTLAASSPEAAADSGRRQSYDTSES